MKDDFVKDWMTANPITVTEDSVLPDAHALLKEYNIRRLPVVNGNNDLVGIVSLTDVREAEPSDATSLSIYELNYLLSRLKVGKIMTSKVLTVTPETTIAEAARLMLEKKIGGLPVVDGKKVVGVITESDIFRLIVQRYAE